MSAANITRLVVGDKYHITLGKPVGQRKHDPDISKTLIWKNGRWERSVSVLERVFQAPAKKSSVIEIDPKASGQGNAWAKLQSLVKRKPNVLIARLVLAVFGTIAIVSSLALMIGKWQESSSPETAELPIAAAPTAPQAPASDQTFPFPDARPAGEAEAGRVVPSAVQVDPGPYVIPPEIKAMLDKPDTAAVPAVAVSAPAVPTPATKQPVIATPSGQPAAAKPPANTQQAASEKVPQAMLFDAEGTAPVTAAAKVPSAPPTPQSTGPKVETQVKAPLKAPTVLVAVTPDGKSALFTNPATRLPERFSVGEKIPGGETIKAIDKNGGTVKTDVRDYKLE